MENQKIVYGPCTQVRRFKADQEEQYRNHLKYLKALVTAYPLTGGIAQVRLYSLMASTIEEFPFLIIITGERAAFMQIAHGRARVGALAEKEKEIIMKEFDGNYRAITPHSSVMNTPSPGESITSWYEFEKTLRDIRSGRYSVAIV